MKALVLLLLVAAASANIIPTRYCPNSSLEVCEIHNIDIEPCPKIKSCKVAKGDDAKISFEFTPHFTTSSLYTEAVYVKTKYDALDSDGCKVTKCPTEAGTRQWYNASLHIGTKTPKGTYTFQWSVSDATNENNKCCLLATVRVIDKPGSS